MFGIDILVGAIVNGKGVQGLHEGWIVIWVFNDVVADFGFCMV